MKDAVGTAYSASSRLWFTCSHGILNEIYHPTIDRAQVRDMEFLVSDGETFVHEEKRDLITTFEYIHPEALGVRYINRDPDGRYALIKEIITDPHHSVLLTRMRLEGKKELVPRLKVYALLAPHLSGGGAGNSARAIDVAGHRVVGPGRWKGHLVVWPPWALSCGFSKVSCGIRRLQRRSWRDLKDHKRMDWEFGSATNGNVSVMGELNLECVSHGGSGESSLAGAGHLSGDIDAREFTVAIGVGDTQHTSLQKTVSALVLPYEQHRARFIEQWHRAASPAWLARKSCDGGKLMRTSHNVLLAHEDKKYSGAFVASASIPWGDSRRATTTWAGTTWCGRATWCRPRVP